MEQTKINHFACEHCTRIWPEYNAYYCDLELDDNYDREHCEYYKPKHLQFVDEVGTFKIEERAIGKWEVLEYTKGEKE